MKVWISGGTGFVGSRLTAHLLGQGHEVTAVGRRKPPGLPEGDRYHFVQADTTQPGSWLEGISQADAVVNLAGATISKRWTDRYKQTLYDSRILTTRHIVQALPADRKSVLVSASAVGYYGDRGEEILTESAANGTDFLAHLSRDWEAEALAAEAKGARVVVARLGVVLGPGGGALAKMIPAFKSFAGGPIGDGRQWFSWIHMQDLVAALHRFIGDEALRGAVNCCAPEPVRNRELARVLGTVLNRPALLPTPAFVLRAALGEMASALLASQRMIPDVLTRHAFPFVHPTLQTAIRAAVRS